MDDPSFSFDRGDQAKSQRLALRDRCRNRFPELYRTLYSRDLDDDAKAEYLVALHSDLSSTNWDLECHADTSVQSTRKMKMLATKKRPIEDMLSVPLPRPMGPATRMNAMSLMDSMNPHPSQMSQNGQKGQNPENPENLQNPQITRNSTKPNLSGLRRLRPLLPKVTPSALRHNSLDAKSAESSTELKLHSEFQSHIRADVPLPLCPDLPQNVPASTAVPSTLAAFPMPFTTPTIMPVLAPFFPPPFLAPPSSIPSIARRPLIPFIRTTTTPSISPVPIPVPIPVATLVPVTRDEDFVVDIGDKNESNQAPWDSDSAAGPVKPQPDHRSNPQFEGIGYNCASTSASSKLDLLEPEDCETAPLQAAQKSAVKSKKRKKAAKLTSAVPKTTSTSKTHTTTTPVLVAPPSPVASRTLPVAIASKNARHRMEQGIAIGTRVSKNLSMSVATTEKEKSMSKSKATASAPVLIQPPQQPMLIYQPQPPSSLSINNAMPHHMPDIQSWYNSLTLPTVPQLPNEAIDWTRMMQPIGLGGLGGMNLGLSGLPGMGMEFLGVPNIPNPSQLQDRSARKGSLPGSGKSRSKKQKLSAPTPPPSGALPPAMFPWLAAPGFAPHPYFQHNQHLQFAPPHRAHPPAPTTVPSVP